MIEFGTGQWMFVECVHAAFAQGPTQTSASRGSHVFSVWHALGELALQKFAPPPVHEFEPQLLPFRPPSQLFAIPTVHSFDAMQLF